ncbi:MAG TPA: hypothetical protein VLY23_06385 [Candidatus Acidoferrum sp.]|nr:hypothetical protein [Candidatus Acidoferrum sp.]
MTPSRLHDDYEDPRLRRRSRRIVVRIHVLVRVETDMKETVWEETDAIVVNAHGGLVLLAAKVASDKFLTIQNPANGMEIMARVTGLGPRFMGKTEVGIEFIRPAPEFWGVKNQPKDWASAASKPRREPQNA